jgi:hypothetical protein
MHTKRFAIIGREPIEYLRMGRFNTKRETVRMADAAAEAVWQMEARIWADMLAKQKARNPA